jgi:hypothetical protein
MERTMDELLARVLDAHGGLDSWSKVATVTAQLSLDGPFWDWRGWPDIRQRQTATLDAHREHITFTPFTGRNLTAVFDVAPERVQIQDADGKVLNQRDNPAASFPPYDDSVVWDAEQLAYFTGTANWNYFTEPFLFTYPGVEAHEVDPWDEDGETWRRLAVHFPSSLPNHNPDQTFYYDKDFLLRRMDYSPDVTGSSPIAHYTHDPKVFDGFVFYTRRLVHLRNPEGVADQSFSPITVVTDSVSVERE